MDLAREAARVLRSVLSTARRPFLHCKPLKVAAVMLMTRLAIDNQNFGPLLSCAMTRNMNEPVKQGN